MATNEVAARIEAFVRTQFSVSPSDTAFGPETDLFEGGYIDSIGVVELLEFLRTEFDVEVPEDDLLSDEFSTFNGIAGIVSRLART